MKKCPVCGSIGPDDEKTCGVCGAALLKVQPMTQTIEQSEIADASKRAAEDASLNDRIRKRTILNLTVAVSIPTAFIISGFVLFFLGFLWGLLPFLIGLILAGYALTPDWYRNNRLGYWQRMQFLRLTKDEEERKAKEQTES